MEKICPKCKNKEVKKNGKNENGRQKYKCKKCNYCFVKRKRKEEKIRGEKLFNKWILKGYSYENLAEEKGIKSVEIKKYIRKKIR